jgi:hypothetical protein
VINDITYEGNIPVILMDKHGELTQTTIDIVTTPPSSPVYPLLGYINIRVMMLQWILPHKIRGLTL